MTIKISKLSKEHLETARTLLRAAQTMTDSVVAGQLKALAEDNDRRAEKASRAGGAAQLDGGLKMKRRHSFGRLLSLNASSVHDLMGSFTGIRPGKGS